MSIFSSDGDGRGTDGFYGRGPRRSWKEVDGIENGGSGFLERYRELISVHLEARRYFYIIKRHGFLERIYVAIVDENDEAGTFCHVVCCYCCYELCAKAEAGLLEEKRCTFRTRIAIRQATNTDCSIRTGLVT